MSFSKFPLIQKRFIQTVKPHTPLIRFRKGTIESLTGHDSMNPPRSSKPVVARPVVEDYQLPLKYRRRPLDETEINAINSGGIL